MLDLAASIDLDGCLERHLGVASREVICELLEYRALQIVGGIRRIANSQRSPADYGSGLA
jgi:hypothetical protein